MLRTALVIGANGQLGKSIQMAVNNSTDSTVKWVFTDITEAPGVIALDALNTKMLEGIIVKCKPDYVINCAAFTDVDREEQVPGSMTGYRVNTELPGVLAGLCLKHCSQLIHISTDYVFDGKKMFGRYTEIDETSPLNAYGRHKLAGERMVEKKLRGHMYMIIRTSWVYSPFKTNFVKKVYGWAKESLNGAHSIRVSTDEVSSPTSAWRLASFIYSIVEGNKLRQGTFNFTDGVVMSRKKFAKEILKAFRLDKDVKVKPAKRADFITPAKRPRRSVLDMSKTMKTFGLKNLTMREWRDVLYSDAICIENWK